MTHAAVQAVDRERKRQPGVDDRRDALDAIDVEVDLGGQLVAHGGIRVDPDPEGARGLQRVDDVQVVRPGFREILPGVRRGIVADELPCQSSDGGLA